ncbi:MAG: PLP-dependent aminotransferase family protein [Candidatus Eremiobacteraeota bacterium]|nr:PLP-dependent aminotransferase family protein [Candidatus Eremiobacteraeota bacterium]
MATIPRATQFAARTSRLRASTIREMLKVTQRPDVISFGGGLPAPELFPTMEIADITRRIMSEYGAAALQYSVTEGIPEMRSWVARRLGRRFGVHFEPESVLITNGSQQGLDLIGKIFLDPGDHVVLENPSYLGAIQAFDSYQARYLTVDTDDDGMIPSSLEQVLAHAEPLPKFVYLVPNFANPTGRTLAAERREPIVRICEHYGVPLIEDDPYGELRFEGRDSGPLIGYRTEGVVLYMGTGSKIVAPGLRVAWIVVRNQEVMERLVLSKQAVDLQTGSLAQYVFAGFVENDAMLEQHVQVIRRVYKQRRSYMLECLRELMPSYVRFNRPEGGMFLWATVERPGFDTEALLRVAAAQKVVFVPGVSFYPHRDVHSGMRLNFSNTKEEVMRRGMERLADAVRAQSPGG